METGTAQEVVALRVSMPHTTTRRSPAVTATHRYTCEPRPVSCWAEYLVDTDGNGRLLPYNENMSDVSFNEEPQYRRPVTVKRSAFIAFAYATGIPKNDTEAQYALLGLAVFAVLLAVGIFFFSSPRSSKPAPLPTDPASVPAHALIRT